MGNNFKILFIYPNTMMATLVPIHLSQISACLKEKGFEVELFDTTFYKTEKESIEQKRVDLLQIKPFNFSDKGITLNENDPGEDLRKKVSEFKPDLIGITMVEDTWELSRYLLSKIKNSGIPVIAGGVFASLNPDEVILNEDINMLCLGEGEEALIELCQKMAGGENYSNIRNLWIKEGGKNIKNSIRPLTDLNEFPYIDYDIFGRQRLARPMFGKLYTMIHVEMDRGCPYQCTYCAAPQLSNLFRERDCGTYYRRKKIPRLMAEMKHLVKKYQPDYINFNSETFLAKPVEELKEMAEGY